MSIHSYRKFLTFAGICLIACQERQREAPTSVESVDIRAMVTPEVAASLTPEGTFTSPTAQSLLGGLAVISPERAAELAVEYMTKFGPFISDHVEKHHGAPVDFTQLTAEPQVMLAESPYSALPPSASMPFHRAYGSYYLVRLRNSLAPVVSVAVSVYDGTMGLSPDGPGSSVVAQGNEFRTWVISKTGSGQPSISPEEAVVAAYRAFGELIAERPRFVRAGAEFTPHIGHWRLVLSRPVRLSTGAAQAVESSSVIYLGANGRFGVSTSVQSSKMVRVRHLMGAIESTVQLPVAPDLAVELREVYPVHR